MSKHKPPTHLQHLIQLFRDALRALGTSPSDRQLEEWSILVHTSMSGGERDYHSVQHVFDVADGAGPIQVLAALFHDTVYVQPDGYLSKRHELMLADVIEKGPSGFRLRPYAPNGDRHRVMLEAIFEFEQGAMLSPWSGLNEFLSTMLAMRSLESILPDRMLIQIAAGIEATVPFRAKDEKGRTPAERLFERLELANEGLSLQLKESELERAVYQAVEVVNRDVASFAFRDTSRFLDYTWKLLPESNIALRRKTTYILGDYRLGLNKMAEFFNRLAPETVFFQFRGIPDDAAIADLTARAATNIERARHYLGAKLAAISVLNALAVVTGGDAPVALFMGDLPSAGRQTMRLEDFLPAPGSLLKDGDAVVFGLLDDGRQRDSEFDTRNSPLAAYIYARIGEKGIARLTANATHSMDVPFARQLLNTLPGDLLNEIVQACSKIALSRTAGLKDLAAGIR